MEKLNSILGKIRNYFNDWKGYTVCYSYDNKNWKRLKTKVNIKKKKSNLGNKSKKRHCMVCVLSSLSFFKK